MTGYGRGTGEQGGKRAIVEIRSVNHRFLDLKLRGASLEPAAEEQLLSAIRKRCERGAVTVFVRAEDCSAGGASHIDRQAAREVHAELVALAADLGIDSPVTLELVCAQLSAMAASTSSSQVAPACVQAAGAQALAALVAMREAEGASLGQDMDRRVARLEGLVTELERHAAGAPKEAQQRLEERLARLLERSSCELDPARLAQEVAILADRQDVTEELVRLRSHLQQSRAVMAREGAVGRRLDFLVQEIGRELSTISSKSQSADIARLVVEARAELEKIREQVQNIE